ncbi:MAG: hypothetical protein ACI9WU_001539, partial [Myxococcota bacterium]
NILSAIPFGGTPLSPSLEDALWLLENHESLTAKTASNVNGDPFHSCRSQNVLLITDGLPNLGEDRLGYGTTVQAAEALFDRGHLVYVVGFALDDAGASLVHDVAIAGGTDYARIADTNEELSALLAAILGKQSADIISKTKTVFTNITGSGVDLQYQVDAAYSQTVTTDVGAYTGYLEVTSYTCEAECKTADGGAGACIISKAKDFLETNVARVFQYVSNGKLRPFDWLDADLTEDTLGIETTGLGFDLSQPAIKNLDGSWTAKVEAPQLDFGGPSGTAERQKFAQHLINLVKSETNTRDATEKLRGIINSTPVIQENLSNFDLPLPAFQEYQAIIAARPTMMYTQTAEGLIRAFHLSHPAATSSYTWFQEVWAIMPEAVLDDLSLLSKTTKILSNGRGILRDIRLRRTAAVLDIPAQAKLWRSILVMPYGEGQRGLLALDVTDPFSPFMRWEITETKHCFLNGDDPAADTVLCKVPADGDVHDFSKVGFIRSQPVIGTVFIKNAAGVAEEVAVAMFGCGEADPLQATSGKCFEVVALDTGKKIKEFENATSTVAGASGASDAVPDTLGFDITGDPAAFSTFIGRAITRLFVGDGGGQLWRLDVSSQSTDDWKMQFFFDPYFTHDSATLADTRREALNSAPALAQLPQRGTLAVLFGTGDVNNEEPNTLTIAYSVSETIAADGTQTSTVNWKRVHALRENMTSAPLVFGNSVHWTSYEAGEDDSCPTGVGRIWGVDIAKDDSGSSVGTLDVDGLASTTDDIVEFIELTGRPTGLALVTRPSCAGDQGVGQSVAGGSADALQASKSGDIELVVQTGKGGATSGSTEAGSAGGGTSSVNKFSKKLKTPPKRVVAVSWALIHQL